MKTSFHRERNRDVPDPFLHLPRRGRRFDFMSYVARRPSVSLLASGLSLVGLLLGTGAQAQTYSLFDLSILGGDSNIGSIGIGINASGQVAGFSVTNGNNTHAFRTTTGGKPIDAGNDLGTLGGTNSFSAGINASGQVTGDSQAINTADHAFRTTATGLVSDAGTDLGTLGGTTSDGYGINNLGQVVGFSYTTGNLAHHAFLYTNSTTCQGGAWRPSLPRRSARSR